MLVENISIAFSNRKVLDGKRIRRLARSNAWRFQWQAGKGLGGLFGRPIIELDPEQQAIVYWSQVYDNVYESMDRPEDSVIENDDELDAWFEAQARKRKVEQIAEGKDVGGVKLSSNMSRHGEIFIVANPNVNPEAPTTQQVEDLNSSLVRTFKLKEAETVKSKGLLGEKELRNRKNKMARKLIGSRDAVLNKNGMGGTARSSGSKILPGGTIS